MRQATAKATRRSLRRAFGEEAVQTIHDQDQAVSILQNAVASCQREIAALAVGHIEHKRDGEITRSAAVYAGARLRHIDCLTFLGRLRWLFTGK